MRATIKFLPTLENVKVGSYIKIYNDHLFPLLDIKKSEVKIHNYGDKHDWIDKKLVDLTQAYKPYVIENKNLEPSEQKFFAMLNNINTEEQETEFYKILGEVSPEATFVRDGSKYEVIKNELNFDFRGKNTYQVKCDCCGTFK